MPGQSDPLFSLGYWIVSHKATLRTWWAMSLLIFMLLGGLWVLLFFGLFFRQESQIDRRLQTTLTRLSSWSPALIGTPDSLTLDEPVVLDRGNGRVDVVVLVTNTNTAWGATDVVVSCTGDASLTFLPATVQAKTTRAVMLLGQKMDAHAALSCAVTGQHWHRLSAALFPTPSFTILTSNVRATTVTVQGRSVPAVTVDATVRNDSGNNLAQVDVPVVVRSGSTIVAADEITIDRWATRDVKHIADTWTGTDGGASTVDMTPQVNIFSADSRF